MNNTSVIEAVRQSIDDNLPAAFEWLKKMVQINSGTRNAAGVRKIALLVEEMFGGEGFTVEYENASDGGAPLGPHQGLVKRGFDGKTIILATHNDTVYPPEDTFSWQEADDSEFGKIIRGPGVLDNKASTISIWLVIRALKKHFPEIFRTITWAIFCNAAEEIGGPQFFEFVKERVDVKNVIAALVFEGESRRGKVLDGVPEVVVGRKGMITFSVRIDGVPGHPASQDRCASAVLQLARVIDRLSTLTDYERQLTLNFGRIEGGTTRNAVAASASALAEIRAFDPILLEWAVHKLGEELGLAVRPSKATKLSEIKGFDGEGDVRMHFNPAKGCRVHIEIERFTPPWKPSASSEKLAAIWQAVGNKIGYPSLKCRGGLKVRPIESVTRGGLSDANALSTLWPVLDGLGAYGENMHSSKPEKSEFLVRDSLGTKAVLNTMSIVQLATSKLP